MSQPSIPKYLETAFQSGFAYTDSANKTYGVYKQEIGQLKIKDGKVIACDPFFFVNDLPFTNHFPLGNFPVDLAIVQIDNDERVAFSRIGFSSEQPVSWTMAVCEGQDLSILGESQIFGYGVDSGTGGFMDTSIANELKIFLESSDNDQFLVDELHKNHKNTRSWLVWESKDCNIALFTAGWGDGFYASYIGYDNQGGICRLVTDFGLINN